MSELARQFIQNGIVWNLYSYTFETSDGVFAGYLYAVSPQHAYERLEELKATAQITGQVTS